MNRLNLFPCAVILVSLLLLGGLGFFFYRMYADLKTLKSQVHTVQEGVHTINDVSTSTAPLVQLFQGIVGANQQLVQQVKATLAPSPEK